MEVDDIGVLLLELLGELHYKLDVEREQFLELFCLIVIEGCHACRARERVAAEREQVGRGRQNVHDLVSCHEASERSSGA